MIAKGFIGFEISLPMAVGVTLNRQLSHRPQADMSSPERILTSPPRPHEGPGGRGGRLVDILKGQSASLRPLTMRWLSEIE